MTIGGGIALYLTILAFGTFFAYICGAYSNEDINDNIESAAMTVFWPLTLIALVIILAIIWIKLVISDIWRVLNE